ncbi:MAG: 3TM-type holin [Pseudooceanicola atlanticus]
MIPSALITLAVQHGFPILERILGGRIGTANAELVGDVLNSIARRAGTSVEDLEAVAESMPETVANAMREVEIETPQMIELYTRGLEGQFDLLMAETEDPAWMRAWRPLGMYVIGFLWLWSIVILHALNAIFRIALPPTDLWMLFQLTALYLTLYMGGHTFKDFAARKWGASSRPK